MPVHIRPATLGDLACVSALLMDDAAERAARDSQLWPVAADAAARIAEAFSTETQAQGAIRWLVAEAGGRVVGVARFGVIACPPIYHLAGQMAFLLYDDTVAGAGAPDEALAALIAAAEQAGRDMGGVISLAACAPVQSYKRRALEAGGYEIVTQYLVKHGLRRSALPSSVRAAAAQDVPAIVAMGVLMQQGRFRANARMWEPHPEAPARFGLWMQYSLTLADRRIFVCPQAEPVGFAIAQPPGAFHLPLAPGGEHLGLIDDFWAPDFSAAAARDLLCAAEVEFALHGRTSAMVICPANWPAKQDFLRANDYGCGNAWMLKA